MLGYQQDVHLFGRKKGSGESVWQIKAQLGVLSTELHMAYIDYADPTVRTAFRQPENVSTWEVVCSGFFDSVGLYSEVTIEQRRRALSWVSRVGMEGPNPNPNPNPNPTPNPNPNPNPNANP